MQRLEEEKTDDKRNKSEHGSHVGINPTRKALSFLGDFRTESFLPFL